MEDRIKRLTNPVHPVKKKMSTMALVINTGGDEKTDLTLPN